MINYDVYAELSLVISRQTAIKTVYHWNRLLLQDRGDVGTCL